MNSSAISIEEFNGKRILIIAPHHDDEVIGCWHFMRALSGLAEIEIAFITCERNNEELTNTRREESARALKGIIIDQVKYLSVQDGVAKGSGEAIGQRVGALSGSIDYVLCPAPNDETIDHRVISEAVANHVQLEKLIWYRSTWWTFGPKCADMVVRGPISEKLTALGFFCSQSHIALERSVRLSCIEQFLSTGTFSSAELFMRAVSNRLSGSPLNSISLYHLPRLLNWR